MRNRQESRVTTDSHQLRDKHCVDQAELMDSHKAHALTLRPPSLRENEIHKNTERNQDECISPYQTLSDFDLKKAMLAALGELSNLRADSKSLRRRLESTRSAIAEIHNRMSLIKQAWDGSDPSRQLADAEPMLRIEE